MVDLQQVNPFSSLDIGIGAIGTGLLILFVSIIILCLSAVLIYIIAEKRKYKFKIPLWKTLGDKTVEVGEYMAKKFPVSRAGDYLWYVRGAKKFLPPATIQIAPNKYPHFEREDGEWINVSIGDIDEQMKKANVRYIHQDMRSQRLATDKLLEQRLEKKGFWEKYQHVIMGVIYFLIIAVCMVIIFYQWSGIIEQTDKLVGKLDSMIQEMEKSKSGGTIVPAKSFIPFLYFSFRNLKNKKKIKKKNGCI